MDRSIEMRYRDAKLLKEGDQISHNKENLIVKSIEIYANVKVVRVNFAVGSLLHTEIID